MFACWGLVGMCLTGCEPPIFSCYPALKKDSGWSARMPSGACACRWFLKRARIRASI